MKDGTEVKVVACRTGHEFGIGEVVTRQSSEYDYEYKDSLGFVGSEHQVWYMCPDEYEIIDTESKLNRIAELEEMLRWYIEEDEINEGDPDNQYWIDGKHKAMKLLGIEIDK